MAKVHSQNGMKDTHGLATIIMQSCTSLTDDSPPPLVFPRINDDEMKKIKFKEQKIHFYSGPKDPSPPKDFYLQNPLSLRQLCNQSILLQRSKDIDFGFNETSTSSAENVPDYVGFNTSIAGESGQLMKAKTKVQFQPLMDRTPSDPSSILTAMIEGEEATTKAGQEVTVFTADQQLYRVMFDITWSDPQRWSKFGQNSFQLYEIEMRNTCLQLCQG